MPITRPPGPTRSLGLRAREQSALAVGADHDHGLTRRAEFANLRGRTGDVEHRQRHALVNVVGQPRPERALEENRLAAHPDAAGRDVDVESLRRSAGASASGRRATRCARPRAGRASSRRPSPTSSTRPTNMPPLPVTGLCCLPRCATIAATCSPMRAASASHASRICLNDAESMLSTSTSQSISFVRGDGRVVERHASCGMAPAGSSTRCAPSGWQRDAAGALMRTVTPPRSNGMLSTTVVRVRAIPGIALRRASSSSRCCVERVTTLQTNVSSPATECTSQISGISLKRARELVVRAVGRRVTADEGGEVQPEPLRVELRGVASNVAALFEALDAIVNGGCLEADDRPQFGKGRARVALQRVEELEVELVEFVVDQHHIRHRRFICRTFFGTITT